MITLFIASIIYTIIGWIIRKKEANKGTYNFSPFLEEINGPALLLVLCTAYSAIFIIVVWIKYLP